jgi:hypothetical protein
VRKRLFLSTHLIYWTYTLILYCIEVLRRWWFQDSTKRTCYSPSGTRKERA